MPRPAIDLESWKRVVIQQYNEGMSTKAIVEHLRQKTGVKTSYRTLQRRLTKWGIPSKLKPSEVTDELREAVKELFFNGASEAELLRVLKLQGFKIEKARLRKLRCEPGMRLLRTTRWLSEEEKEQQEQRLQNLVEEELDKGNIQNLGRTQLYKYFRSLGHHSLTIAQQRLYDAVKAADPDGVRRRPPRKTGGASSTVEIPGPDKLHPSSQQTTKIISTVRIPAPNMAYAPLPPSPPHHQQRPRNDQPQQQQQAGAPISTVQIPAPNNVYHHSLPF